MSQPPNPPPPRPAPTPPPRPAADPVTESFCCPELGSKQIALPIQVLQLPSLEGVLNHDTWNSLTKEEQDKLAALLPKHEAADRTATVDWALASQDRLLGTTAPNRCLGLMKSGLLHPTLSEHRKRSRELMEVQHTYDVRDYHNKMVYRLLKYKDNSRAEIDMAAADSHKTPDVVPPTTPRHAWAVPIVEAIHRILQRSPGKQAKFDHLFEIIHCTLVPSRQPLMSETDENPVRYLLRSALLFMCQHPVDQPMVQPNSSLNHHGDFYWNQEQQLTKAEICNTAAQFSQQLLQSTGFLQQIMSTVSLGNLIAATTVHQAKKSRPSGISSSSKKKPAPTKPVSIMSHEDAIREFHKQEYARYTNPYRPFRYIDAITGHTTVVAPLRKASHAQSTKGRDHSVLTPERPPHVTVLALVRDAAARLPEGVGSKEDISSLLRISQYMLTSVTDSHISQVVSNALDRLLAQHVDPCVEYCNRKKQWIYKHLHRSETDFINKRGQPTNRPPVKSAKSQASPTFQPAMADGDVSDASGMSQDSEGEDDL